MALLDGLKKIRKVLLANTYGILPFLGPISQLMIYGGCIGGSGFSR
jgi:hypothetical protein